MATTKITTKDNLIKNISAATEIEIPIVKAVYNGLETEIKTLLAEANKEQDVTVKVFEGISFDSTWFVGKEKKNNLTGKMYIPESKIKPKVNITRRYCEKINEACFN